MKKLMTALAVCLLTACVAQVEPVECLDYDANTGTSTNAARECTISKDYATAPCPPPCRLTSEGR